MLLYSQVDPLASSAIPDLTLEGTQLTRDLISSHDILTRVVNSLNTLFDFLASEQPCSIPVWVAN